MISVSSVWSTFWVVGVSGVFVFCSCVVGKVVFVVLVEVVCRADYLRLLLMNRCPWHSI